MLNRVMMTILAMAMAATAAGAQSQTVQTTPAKTAEAKSEAAASKVPEPAPLPVNIRIEVSITDQTGSNTPARKVVSMIAGDRQSTNIRSNASVPVRTNPDPKGPTNYSYRNVTINVDARPVLLQKDSNKISVSFGLEYLPKTGGGGAEELEPGMSQLTERLGLILESGKPMIVSQAADPISDRKITVEVTATILK
jgi:glucose/arabinose dehydrogenase